MDCVLTRIRSANQQIQHVDSVQLTGAAVDSIKANILDSGRFVQIDFV